jgi:hypothetical protein
MKLLDQSNASAADQAEESDMVIEAVRRGKVGRTGAKERPLDAIDGKVRLLMRGWLEHRLPNVLQTSGDCLDHPFRLIGIPNLDAPNASFSGRIVVSADKQSIPDKNHFSDRNAQDVPELSNTIGFVNARFGDIDRCCAAQMD